MNKKIKKQKSQKIAKVLNCLFTEHGTCLTSTVQRLEIHAHIL